MPRTIRTVEDLLHMLDAMFDAEADRWTDRGASWWDGFYGDRSRGVPFFRPAPDESLVTWHKDGHLEVPLRGRALDLGCPAGTPSGWPSRATRWMRSTCHPRRSTGAVSVRRKLASP